MNNKEKASISIIKILGVCLILLLVTGIGVKATSMKLTNVKVVLANDYEMNVLTSKTKVSEILEDNHVVLLEDEKSIPDLNEEISDNKTIKIVKQDYDTENEEKANTVETKTTEEILSDYASIIEKIVKEQVEIPYETITKYVSETVGTKKEKVTQEGENGIKEITYQVKYQNDVEIEKVELSSVVIKEPVNKIVQIQSMVTSRGSSTDRTSAVSYGKGTWSYSASDMDLLCAITAQECSSSYAGALAVITTACNRAESSKWSSKGTDPLSQYKAKGQFCYSIDNYWKKRLNGNYSSVVKQAVTDALNGKRNHNYLSFRSAGSHSGEVIGGNVYF